MQVWTGKLSELQLPVQNPARWTDGQMPTIPMSLPEFVRGTKRTVVTMTALVTPARFEQNFRWAIFKLILVIKGWGICCEIAIRWMTLDITDDKPILVQVMAWCHQTLSHYLNKCWPRSMSPYGITRHKELTESQYHRPTFYVSDFLLNT